MVASTLSFQQVSQDQLIQRNPQTVHLQVARSNADYNKSLHKCWICMVIVPHNAVIHLFIHNSSLILSKLSKACWQQCLLRKTHSLVYRQIADAIIQLLLCPGCTWSHPSQQDLVSIDTASNGAADADSAL